MEKIAIITGASSGIGKSTAKLLDDNHYQCFLLARSKDKLDQLKSELKNDPVVVQCDLSSKESIEKAIHYIYTCAQKIDVLVNNAGQYSPASLTESTPEIWQKEFQVNVFGPSQLSLGLLDLLKKSEEPTIINISSTLGNQPAPNTGVYSASKAAMNSWTKSMAQEWGEYGIRVNAICPGIVDTPIHAFHNNEEDIYQEQKNFAHSMHLLGRMGTVEDISKSVLHFVEQKWATGSIFNLDGGISLK